MKKRIFSVIVAFGVSLIILGCFYQSVFPSNIAYAAETLSNGIIIESEYFIPDEFGWCTCYVLVARNEAGKDISVTTDFTAYGREGKVACVSHDNADAIKDGQTFITYGQFRNDKIADAQGFSYKFNIAETGNCTYSMVNVDTDKKENYIEVSATNYSEKDIQGVGIRTLFLKNGKAVAFDTVNIADVGYTLYGGSTSSQVIGQNAADYDDFIITYLSAAKTF